jgi:hypothetical protein
MPARLRAPQRSLVAELGALCYRPFLSARTIRPCEGLAAMIPEPPRKPLRATLSDPRSERRLHRLRAPHCAACGHNEMFIVLRTDEDLFFRCEFCARVAIVAKPGRQRFGT